MNFIKIFTNKTNIIIITILFISNNILSQNQDVPFLKSSFSQQKKELKIAKRNIKKGDQYYKKGSGMYINALNYYSKAWEFNPNNAMLNYKIGRCLINSIKKASALKYFEKSYELNPNVAKDINYFLGQAYQLNNEFDKAISAYNNYKSTLSPQSLLSKNAINIATIDKKIAECNHAKILINNPVRVFIDNLGSNINTEYPDYAPVISKKDDIMYFTSKRENTTKNKRNENNNMKFYEDIYVSYNVNGVWSEAKNNDIDLNTSFNDATVNLSPDEKIIYIYKGSKGGDIYSVILKDKSKFGKVKKLNKFINSKAHETSLCITKDGNTIYFTSNRSGGLGEGDIYYITKNYNNKWEKPINLGPVINTPYDENSVFLSEDEQTLYFSSKGHNSMGGYDIFKSVKTEDGKWGPPENLGYPINTPADELYFKILPEGNKAYMASTRDEGIGDYDIFMITFLGPEKPLQPIFDVDLPAFLITKPEKILQPEEMIKLKTLKQTIVKGTISDDFSSEPISAVIEIIDNKTNTIINTIKASPTGNYMISLPSGKNYGIAVKAENYLFHSENFDIPATTEYQEITKDIKMKKIEVGTKIVLNNIFFDFGKATLRPESKAELDRLTNLMKEMPELKIEISGHTDNKGNPKSNQILSEKRAKAVVDYLIANGISKDRLKYVGYGQTQPIASNDTDEGRQLNRRTEFKILSK